MRLGTAIERLVENYNYAVSKEWVQDKVAWALYHTWKEADKRRAEQTEPNCNADQRFQHVEYVEDDELKRCRECKHCVGEYHTPISASGRYYAYITCTANRCNYEKTEPQIGKAKGESITTDKTEQTEPQTYVINPQEPTNDDKCFECDDFFTCDGQGDEVEDEPQTDCAWK